MFIYSRMRDTGVVRACDPSKTRRGLLPSNLSRDLPPAVAPPPDDERENRAGRRCQIRITRSAVWHSTRAGPRGHAYRLGVCAPAHAPVPLASCVSASLASRVSRLALARLVNERKDGREASPAAPEPLPRGAPPRGVGQDEPRRRRRALLRSAEMHTRRPRDRLGAHRPPFPPSGTSSRPASPTSLPHPSSPVNAEPSPPEIAHFRPTPRSPRAGS